jgi:hypothetical protein
MAWIALFAGFGLLIIYCVWDYRRICRKDAMRSAATMRHGGRTRL